MQEELHHDCDGSARSPYALEFGVFPADWTQPAGGVHDPFRVGMSIDESRFPVVVIECWDRMDDDDVVGFLAGGQRWLTRKRPYAIIVVARQAGIPAIATLKPALQWMKDRKADLDRWHRGFALVTDSAVVRGAMRAILVLRPMSAHQLVTASRDEAIAWAQELVAHGHRSAG
jgi:hypothetical protein